MEKESFCEILFRGKRKDNGEWIEGFYAECKNTAFISSMPCVKTMRGSSCDRRGITDYCGLGFFYEVVPETVSRFTGLTDKNGRKIFEGDIIRHYNGSETLDVGVINYDEDHCVWCRTSSKSDDLPYIWKSCVYEVIGNIHDDPELMK